MVNRSNHGQRVEVDALPKQACGRNDSLPPIAFRFSGRAEFDHDLLALDPRHTGANHLSEVALLQHAGALQWQAISRRAGMRMRELRGEYNQPVYASFYYVGIFCPPFLPLSSHRIDDRLLFSTSIRLFGDTMIDGWHLMRREQDIVGAGYGNPAASKDTWIRMSNVFVAKCRGAAHLEVCSPVNLEPRLFPCSSERFDTYSKIKKVRRRQEFAASSHAVGGLVGEGVTRIPINPDRDINGVGLVYFANYITFLDTAERRLLEEIQSLLPRLHVTKRSLVRREIAYYANANADDEVEVRVRIFQLEARPKAPHSVLLHFAYEAHRLSDGRLLCISAADKLVPQLIS